MEILLVQRRRLGIAYLAGALIALANGGCLLVAAGAAAGGGAAAGYVYCKGKVCDEFNANLDDVWAATHTSLVELGMPVLSEERGDGTGVIKTQLANGDKVRIHFDVVPSKIPVEGPLTRVGVRVATFGDHPASERILQQIGAHLMSPAAAQMPNPAPGVALQPPNSVAGPPPQPVPVRGQSAEPPLLNPAQR
jgi:hypothetical protein